MAKIVQVVPVNDTFLKLSEKMAAQLPPNQKRFRAAGDPLNIISVERGPANHWVFHFANPGLTIGDGRVLSCLAWPEDWPDVGEIFAKVQALNCTYAIQNAAPLQGASQFREFRRDSAGTVIAAMLNIAYKSQTDNRNNPGGSCNVTSIAIGMAYFQLEGKRPSMQLEDELYEAMEARGLSRHRPDHLQQIAEIYGMISRFTCFAKLADIKAAIASGRPCIFHGYFTSFGHIIVAVGFDEKGFFVHDPYGEWTANGYLKNDDRNPKRGKYLHYSYGLVDAKCRGNDGSFWCHFLDRLGWQPQSQPIALPQVAVKPSNLSTVKARCSTPLKVDWAKQADQLQPSEKYTIAAGQTFECLVSPAKNGHLMLTLPDAQKLFGADVWYGFAKDFEITTPGGLSPTTPGSQITRADIDRAAAEIGVKPRALQAVIEIEAAGSGFLPSGRPVVLFEAHWFGYYSGDQFNESHPDISSYTWNRALYKGGELEWDRLEKAATLDCEAAYKSASYGLGQIMGFHYEALGYPSVMNFVECMSRSEGEQLLAMARFIGTNREILRALKALDWAGFAYHYNGEGYAANAYDVRLAKAYAALT